jgi:ferredoxin-NADP reductase
MTARPRRDPRDRMAPARLAEKVLVNDSEVLAVFRVEPLKGEVADFEAGQFTRLGWEHEGKFEQRSYSIASAPEQRDAMEFYIVDTRLGLGTSHLFSFPVDTPLWIAPPVGKFTFSRHFAPHLALVGSGTGVAPFVGMVRHLVDEAKAGRRIPESVSVWHGVRSTIELGYREEFEALVEEAPFPFFYMPCVSRHHDEADFDAERVNAGRVNEILAMTLGLTVSDDPRGIHFAGKVDPDALRASLPIDDSLILLCGNPAMIDAFEQVAAGSSWADRTVYERWW